LTNNINKQSGFYFVNLTYPADDQYKAVSEIGIGVKLIIF